jgi:hypothetical protein
MENKNQTWEKINEEGHISYKRIFGKNENREIIVETSGKGRINSILFQFPDYELRMHIQQFFFKNDKLVNWRYLREQGDAIRYGPIIENYYKELPENRPAMPEEYKISFQELGAQIKSIKNSLEKCVEIIS